MIGTDIFGAGAKKKLSLSGVLAGGNGAADALRQAVSFIGKGVRDGICLR